MEPTNNEENTNMAPDMSTDTPPQAPGDTPTEPEKRSLGPIIGIVLVVVLLVLGALYFFFWYQPTPEANTTSQEAVNVENDPVTAELQTQSDSSDITSIEADLQATNYDNLDADVTSIEAELSGEASQ